MKRDVRGVGFKKTTPISEALNKWIKESNLKTESERVKVSESVNRISFTDVNSLIDLPPYSRSAMDGYAVRAETVYDASPLNPVTLKVKGRIPVDGPLEFGVNKEETIEVTTGSPIPEGADAVVMLERVKRFKDKVQIYSSVKPFENVIRKGKDFQKGGVVLRRGDRIASYDIGVLKAIGVEEIDVARKPVVAIGATGTETVESLEDAQDFKVVDVNRPTLISLIKEAGGKPIDLGIMGDEIEEIINSIKRAIPICDVMTLTGGTSVGSKDNTAAAIENLKDSKLIAHGISIRPGMPTALWIVNGKPVATLPGSPVAAVISFLYLVKPMLHYIMRLKIEEPCRVKAFLTRRIVSPVGVRSFVRVSVKKNDERFEATPVRVHGSAMMSSMVRANGILEVPENVEGYDAGEKVEITLIKPITLAGD